MFGDDGNEPLQAAKDCTMDHDRSCCGLISRAVLQVEAFGKLEVKLDSSTLERTAKSIADSNVDLGTIESSISRVELPFTWVVCV